MGKLDSFGVLHLMVQWLFLKTWSLLKQAVLNHLHHFQLVCKFGFQNQDFAVSLWNLPIKSCSFDFKLEIFLEEKNGEGRNYY